MVERRPGTAVALAFVVTAAYLTAQAARVRDYTWFIDELLYVKVAQSFANGELWRAEVYGEPIGLPNTLYPRLLAPLYALLPSVDAFTAAHVLNALLFAGVIVPVYLLARHVGVTPGLSLLAGLAAAWCPWAVATTAVMTESLAYVTFAWALLAIVVALSSPSARTHALALAAIGVATYARIQFALLFGVLAAGTVLHALAIDNATRRAGGTPPTPLRDRLRPHLPLAVMLGAIAAGLAALAIAGVSPFGVYDTAVDRMRFPFGWFDAAGRHLAYITVGMGVLPMVLWVAWLPRAATTPRTSAEAALAVTGGLAVAALLYLAGDFAQNIAGGRVQERYVFYIVPIVLVGAAALLADRREPRPRLGLVAAGVAVATVVAVPHYRTSISDPAATLAAAGSGIHHLLQLRAADLTDWLPGEPLNATELLAVATVVFGAALVPLMRLSWRNVVAPVTLVLTLAFGATVVHYLFNRIVPPMNAIASNRVAGDAATPKDWIDRAAGDADVGLVPNNLARDLWLRAEFWNKSVAGFYRFPGHGGLTYFPAFALDVDDDGRVHTDHEFPLLAVGAGDPVLGLRGEVVAEAAYGMRLLRPERPYRALWWAGPARPDGWSEGTAPRRIRVFSSGTLQLSLWAPAEAERPVPFVVSSSEDAVRGTLAPGGQQTVSINVPEPGVVRVRALRATDVDGDIRGVNVIPLEVRE